LGGRRQQRLGVELAVYAADRGHGEQIINPLHEGKSPQFFMQLLQGSEFPRSPHGVIVHKDIAALVGAELPRHLQVGLAFDAILSNHAGETGVRLDSQGAKHRHDTDEEHDKQAASRATDPEMQEMRQIYRFVIHLLICGPSNMPPGM
jgi:hypothetical protein